MEDILDVTNPEEHCTQNHDHFALPWDLSGCPWQELLMWSMNDHGFNEGAEVAGSLAAQYGLGLPPDVAGLVGQGLGNVWDRCNMMHFAADVARTGNIDVAVGIAIASQWHNCHALKCLVFHAVEVAAWIPAQ